MAPFNLARLKSTLLSSGLQRKDPDLYQVINQIIDFTNGNIGDINARIGLISGGSGGGGGGGGFAPTTAGYLTTVDEHVTLPNSRELLPGTNVTFDDTVAHQRTINVASTSGTDHVVASDGGIPVCSPIDDGAGSFIYILYTP